MVRTPRRDNSGLKKGTWTPEEDRKLIAYVTRYGCWNWRQIPKFAGLARCGKSCRLRWLNYLRPDVKRGNYSQEEEETIIRLHEKLGNRWSAIAAHLPGRTDNEIKNHWHTALKKRCEHKSSDTTTSRGTGKAEVTKSKNHSPVEEEKQVESENSGGTPHTCPLSPQPSSSGLSSSSITTDTATINHENWVHELAFMDAHAYIEPVSSDFWTEPYLTDDISYVPPSEATMQLLCEHEYFIPMNDVQLWSHNNLDQEYGGLFY